MALEGTLKDFGLADIFQLIGLQKKTGVLTLASSSESVDVLFLDGKIVYADSKKKRLEDRLGTVLVKRGLLSQDQLEEALGKQKKTLRRLGHILVNDGYLTRQQMQEALYLQVSQILYRLFHWKDGDYKFSQEETIDYDEENFVPIPPESILMEGMQMIDEWPIIEKKIRSFDMVFERVEVGEDAVKIKEAPGDDFADEDFELDLGFDEAPKEEPEEEVGGITLSQEEAEVYDLIDGRRTVREITYRSSMNEFSTCRVLYDLLSRNLITESGARKEEAEAAAKAVAAARPVRHTFLTTLGYILVIAGIVISLATFWKNPFSGVRWLTRPQMPASEFGMDISRMRLERLDFALQVYELQNNALPATLQELADQSFVDPSDLLDPWGRPFTYLREEGGDYSLGGNDASGQVAPSLLIYRPAKSRATAPGRYGRSRGN